MIESTMDIHRKNFDQSPHERKRAAELVDDLRAFIGIKIQVLPTVYIIYIIYNNI